MATLDGRSCLIPNISCCSRALLGLALLGLLASGCSDAEAGPTDAKSCDSCTAASLTFSAKRTAGASSAFWQHWGDGKAELSGYSITTMRYGQARKGKTALIYVTEPHDKRSLIKDDRAGGDNKLNVIKLNHTLTFDTGIYPYSVMTSVFTPVDAYDKLERFSPSKIALSAQEWCGHVYHKVVPQTGVMRSSIRSYFASEGETEESVKVGDKVIYEDALLIQLRELDGAFAGGGNWSGKLVPTLWATRKAHRALRPVDATITRSEAQVGGKTVSRFVLAYGSITRTFDIEKASPRRVLGWTVSDGEVATLLKTTRLPYWSLHNNGQESERAKLGL
jgi:hypothetical protein